MSANQPENLVPLADRDRAPSAGDMANPDELKDDLENTNTGKRWRNHSSRRNGAKPSGAGRRIRLIWRGRSGRISRVIYMKIWRRVAARFESLPMSGARGKGWGDSGWRLATGTYEYKIIINK